jgi:hypothetical protein
MFDRTGTKPPYRSGHLWRQHRARMALPIAGVDRSLLGNMVNVLLNHRFPSPKAQATGYQLGYHGKQPSRPAVPASPIAVQVSQIGTSPETVLSCSEAVPSPSDWAGKEYAATGNPGITGWVSLGNAVSVTAPIQQTFNNCPTDREPCVHGECTVTSRSVTEDSLTAHGMSAGHADTLRTGVGVTACHAASRCHPVGQAQREQAACAEVKVRPGTSTTRRSSIGAAWRVKSDDTSTTVRPTAFADSASVALSVSHLRSLSAHPLQSPFEGPSSGQPECMTEALSTDLPKEGTKQ